MGIFSLEIEIYNITGDCPVYKVGKKFIVKNGYKIPESPGISICTHSVASMLPWLSALSNGVSPRDLGLNADAGDNSAFVQCPDPGPPITCGGSVIFRITPVQQKQ